MDDLIMDDLISRQAAIRWVKTECNPYGKPTLEFESGKKVIEHLEQMPSAQSDSKTACWVPLDERFASWSSYYKCSECGFRINLRTVMDFSGQSVDYCPHCGARMEVKHEA